MNLGKGWKPRKDLFSESGEHATLDHDAMMLVGELYASCSEPRLFSAAVSKVIDYLHRSSESTRGDGRLVGRPDLAPPLFASDDQAFDRGAPTDRASPTTTIDVTKTAFPVQRYAACGRDDGAIASLMLAHIGQARAIANELSGVREELGILHDALDRLRMGWALTDVDGYVQLVSKTSAQRFRKYGINVRLGEPPRFRVARQQRAYDKALRSVDRVTEADGDLNITMNLCDARSGSPLLVLCLPSTPDLPWSPLFAERRYVMHFLIDAEDQHRRIQSAPPLNVVLTSTERRILGFLIAGLAVRDIADLISRSELTVRDHVKNILAKTPFSRQSELVASLFRDATWLVEDGDLEN